MARVAGVLLAAEVLENGAVAVMILAGQQVVELGTYVGQVVRVAALVVEEQDAAQGAQVAVAVLFSPLRKHVVIVGRGL